MPGTGCRQFGRVVLVHNIRGGSPTSITFTGKPFAEAELLIVAKVYQDTTEFHLHHPAFP